MESKQSEMFEDKEPECTFFPEKWITWTGKIVDIHDLCVKHDKRCGSHGFYKGTWERRLVGAVLIATVASIACWVKHWTLMRDKV